MVDQAGETGVELNHCRAAGDAIRPGIHNCARLARAFLGAVLVAAGANFVVALQAWGSQAPGRPEIAQNLFSDNADDVFDFALVQRFKSLSSLYMSRTGENFCPHLFV